MWRLWQWGWSLVLIISVLEQHFIASVPEHAHEQDSETAYENLFKVDYSHNEILLSQLRDCDRDGGSCDHMLQHLYPLSAKIANEHNALLLNDRSQQLFEDILYFLGSRSPKMRAKVCHILSAIAFSNGNWKQAEHYHSCMDPSDLIALRSLASQLVIAGSSRGVYHLDQYAQHIEDAFLDVLNRSVAHSTTKPTKASSTSLASMLGRTILERRPLDRMAEDFILSFLLSETQGGVRTTTRLVDLSLALTNIATGFDEGFRFRLGVGLAKLGLHDLSVRQVSLAAQQSDTPLYQLRAKLVFPPVHSSIGTLAAAVNHFERQMEAILLQEIPQTEYMTQVCNSLNEAALALQALPLLHLIGFSAPRVGNALGHLPVPLPILLGEIYVHMCPETRDREYDADPADFRLRLLRHPPALSVSSTLSRDIAVSDFSSSSGSGSMKHSTPLPRSLSARDDDSITSRRKLHIGIVAGSFDSLPGRIMIGLLDTLPDRWRRVVEFTAMCFPTPRSPVTDRVNALFDHHINLSTDNKTQVLARIADAQVDFVLFADAAMDARVFALAHERLALYQGLLWSWGGTLGIPTIDFYFLPELFLQQSRCRVHFSSRLQETSGRTIPSHMLPKAAPAQHFREQVVWLEGIPELMPRKPALRAEEAAQILMQRYLLEVSNRTHIYLFPASVKHLHPEFDRAVEVIFRTDPLALVVLAVVKSGRDNLPTTHIAVTHDLLHPAMPLAGVHKLKHRLRAVIKAHPDRIRVLPPLEEQLYRALLRQAVVVLDPYPVGLHTAILEAMLDRVPVVTAPALQECTNSHAYSLTRFLNIMPRKDAQTNRSSNNSGSGEENVSWTERDFFPTSAEEYGVLAVRVAKDMAFREQFLLAQKSIVFHPELYHAITVDGSAQYHDVLPMPHHAQQYFAVPKYQDLSEESGTPASSHAWQKTSGRIPHRPTHLEQIVRFVQQLYAGDLAV